ncbi:pyridoxal phosphate-dependent transferase [Dunaliella salina]|uniref:Aspartate aminotransferase n=1 Tax=Dunaliella salina TaxID=3046 RepID=A0ABQ7GS66_DUNSA|nr:pyridoxal phosphate-dependent transferase [Dunaliella salina]|eukprot:KAF5837449.1 pyridoxal phosphate-dependent transferase [Dunaliella salina]
MTHFLILGHAHAFHQGFPRSDCERDAKAIQTFMLMSNDSPFAIPTYRSACSALSPKGFASGDCERDAKAIRIFLDDGHQLGCSQSYAKNMGLYGQRVGAFSIVTGSKKEAAAVESQMKNIARPMYSNPPLHGALLVTKILQEPALKNLWYDEVKMMAHRIILMRSVLRKNLEELNSPWKWNHITDQIGMFAYSGLSPEHVDKLAQQHSIYMTRNGRISMAGITSKNVNRLSEAIHHVICEKK